MENTNWKTSVQHGVKKFVFSWVSLVLFASILALISIVQIFVFVFTDVSMSGMGSEDKQAWVTWVFMLVSLPFGISSVLGMTFSIRGSNKFIFFALMVNVGYIITGLCAGMMYSAMGMTFMIGVNLFRYYKQKTGGINYSLNKQAANIFLGAFITVFFITGVVSIELDDNHIFWWNEGVYGDSHFTQYMDLLAAVFSFMGGFMILTKNKFAFTSLLICDVFFLLAFIEANQWSSIAITLMYLVVEVLGIIVWHMKGNETLMTLEDIQNIHQADLKAAEQESSLTA